MSDRYDYANVSEEAINFAVREINENPSEVNAHIESLRKWVNSMPHLTCPTDTGFLLKFLRVAKFDHAKAQKRLDRFCTLRSSTSTAKFLNMFDVNYPIVEKYLNTKFSLPLGTNEAGEMVVILRCHVYDPDMFRWPDFASLFYMQLNMLIMDETAQIFGVKFILDMDHVSRRALEAVGHPNDIRDNYRIAQGSFPLRIKSQIFYNEPVLFEIVFKIISFFMSDKMKSRTFRLSNDIRKAEKQIPGLMKILPKEYNGEGDTIDNIAEKWNNTFREFYKNDTLFSSVSVDESKRPSESKYPTKNLEYKGKTLGSVGTFTKFGNTF